MKAERPPHISHEFLITFQSVACGQCCVKEMSRQCAFPRKLVRRMPTAGFCGFARSDDTDGVAGESAGDACRCVSRIFAQCPADNGTDMTQLSVPGSRDSRSRSNILGLKSNPNFDRILEDVRLKALLRKMQFNKTGVRGCGCPVTSCGTNSLLALAPGGRLWPERRRLNGGCGQSRR